MAAAGDVVPVCAAGLDALLVQLVWENLSLLQGSPHTGDALHATLLEDVAMQEPDASFAGGAGNPPSGEPDIEERMADADAAVKAAVLVSLEKRVRDLEAAAEPSGGSAAAPPVVHALAAANDASGCLAWAAGRPADGEPLLRRARELRMHALGPTGAAPLLAAHSTMHLGALLHILHFRSADEAELLLRSAVELLDALPPGNAPAEVAPLLRAALPVFESHYGAEHPLTATLHSNLALALKDHGRLEEAEPLLRRALAVREAVHGPTHLDTMRTMNNLAGLVEAKGDLEEAEALLRRAAEMAASSLGPMHAATANALSNLGVALRKVWRGLRAGVRVHGTSAYDGVGAPRRQGANRLRSCKDLAYPVTSSQTACGDLC
eukprot:XP_001697452.1 flagellar associated protein [Chlamydomonas reinhardtii]